MTKWITVTLDFKAAGSISSPVPLGHAYWVQRLWWSVDTLKGRLLPQTGHRLTARGLITLYNLHFWMIYFRISYLLHLNHRWPWTNKSEESKTTGKEDTKDATPFSYSFMESNMAITQIVANISNPHLHKNTELNVRAEVLSMGDSQSNAIY